MADTVFQPVDWIVSGIAISKINGGSAFPPCKVSTSQHTGGSRFNRPKALLGSAASQDARPSPLFFRRPPDSKWLKAVPTAARCCFN